MVNNRIGQTKFILKPAPPKKEVSPTLKSNKFVKDQDDVRTTSTEHEFLSPDEAEQKIDALDDSIDDKWWLDFYIEDDLEELRNDVDRIYRDCRTKIRMVYGEVLEKDNSVYFENVDYLARLAPISLILIDDTIYYKMHDGDMLLIADGKTYHPSRVAPKNYLLRGEPIMEIKHDAERKALGHYDKKLDYFNKVNLLNAAMSKKTFDEIIDMMPVSNLEGMNILDFGCGTGETAIYILQNYNVNSITCVDYSPKRMEEFERIIDDSGVDRNKLNLHVQDVNYFVQEDQYKDKFDVILTFEIIEHLKDPEWVVGLLKDLLVDNGSIIGTIPLQSTPNDVHLTAYRTVQDVTEALGVAVNNNFKMRFPNQRVFHYLKA